METDRCTECGAPENYVDQLANVRAVASVALQTLRHLQRGRGTLSRDDRERISDTIAMLNAELSISTDGVRGIDGPRRGPVADGSQTPNDAAAIPRAKAGSNTDADGVATRHPRCGYPYCACVGECFAASQPGGAHGVREVPRG